MQTRPLFLLPRPRTFGSTSPSGSCSSGSWSRLFRPRRSSPLPWGPVRASSSLVLSFVVLNNPPPLLVSPARPSSSSSSFSRCASPLPPLPSLTPPPASGPRRLRQEVPQSEERGADERREKDLRRGGATPGRVRQHAVQYLEAGAAQHPPGTTRPRLFFEVGASPRECRPVSRNIRRGFPPRPHHAYHRLDFCWVLGAPRGPFQPGPWRPREVHRDRDPERPDVHRRAE